MNTDPSAGTDPPQGRPAEPEHPMNLEGGIVPGDVVLMVRCMLEELLQVGLAPQELAAMSRDSNYQALFAARQVLGNQGMDELIVQTLRRVGRHRHRVVEATGDSQAVTLTIHATH